MVCHVLEELHLLESGTDSSKTYEVPKRYGGVRVESSPAGSNGT